MPATSVYGIHIGDAFKDADGEVFTVLEFITPTGPHIKWKAKVKTDQMVDPLIIEVENLEIWEKVS